MIGAVVLAAAVLAVAALAPAPADDDAWEGRVDLPLMLALGVGVAVLDATWVARFHLAGWPLTASDFFQYCESVAALRAGDIAGVHNQRSAVAGLLPAAFAGRWGILGGLAIGAAVSHGIQAAATYLWARALGGREAGVAAALLMAAVGPVVLLTRNTTFYPEAVAAIVLAGAAAAAAVRWPNPGTALLAGGGVGLALLADVRAIYLATAALAVAGLGLLRGPGRWLPVRLGALLAPVVGSYLVGTRTASPDGPGLYQQTAFYVRDALAQAGLSTEGFVVAGYDFLWGRSPPERLLDGLLPVLELSRRIPAGLADAPQVAFAREIHILPWLLPAAVALLGAGWRLRHDPLRLVALLGLVAPYAVALRTAAVTRADPRYLGMAMAALPVVLGLGAVGLVTRAGGRLPPRVGRAVRLGVVLLLVVGIVPSWLSPAAPWRQRVTADEHPRTLLTAPGGMPFEVECRRLLDEDRAAGRTWAGYGVDTARPREGAP